MRESIFQLYVIEMNVERGNHLREELATLPQVTVSSTYSAAVETSGGLDALVVSLMSATEWGAMPIPAPLYQTRVVQMPKAEIALGRPPYAVPGVAIAHGEILDPVQTTRLVLKEILRAISIFNEKRDCRLEKIAAVSSSLGLDKLKTGEALALLTEAFSSLGSFDQT
jgi:hypothetical protein